jgi:tRNA A37 threonylcarbamoyladenosine dehydratase
VFNPLTAYFGGFVAQEIVKAITNKFTPVNQAYYYNACEVCPDFEFTEEMLSDAVAFSTAIKQHQIEFKDRQQGLRICVGQELTEKLKYTKLFMVGAGAIGCELLKNYAMLGVGTGKPTYG